MKLLIKDFQVPEHTVRVALVGSTKQEHDKLMEELKAHFIKKYRIQSRPEAEKEAEKAVAMISKKLSEDAEKERGEMGLYNRRYNMIFLFLDRAGMRITSKECTDYEDIVLATFNHEALHHIDKLSSALDGTEARAYMMTAMTKAFWPQIKAYLRTREKCGSSKKKKG